MGLAHPRHLDIRHGHNSCSGWGNTSEKWCVSLWGRIVWGLFRILRLSSPDVVVESLRCVWLFCDPMDSSLPGSSLHGILQARILGWVAISFSRDSSQPRDQTPSPTIVGGFFTTEPQGNPLWPPGPNNQWHSSAYCPCKESMEQSLLQTPHDHQWGTNFHFLKPLKYGGYWLSQFAGL